MELGTFGAILGFAMDLEEQATAFYGRAAPGGLGRVFDERAQDVKKRLRRLERARRELVSEMILESITGLDGDNYSVTLDAEADEATLLAQARDLEAVSTRFYRDAATKMPIREVARLFERMADERARCRHEGR